MTERIQLIRKRGWKLPDNTVDVTTGPFASPFTAGQVYFVMDTTKFRRGDALSTGEWHTMTPEDAVDCYQQWFSEQVGTSGYALTQEALADLAGKNLACTCPLTKKDGSPYPCHADVLLDLFTVHTADTTITYAGSTLTVNEWAERVQAEPAEILANLGAGARGVNALRTRYNFALLKAMSA